LHTGLVVPDLSMFFFEQLPEIFGDHHTVSRQFRKFVSGEIRVLVRLIIVPGDYLLRIANQLTKIHPTYY
jgi:hypothetical protein